MPTGHTFTGQKLDGTGLQYYNARYYDPTIGVFISPDTIVPDAGLVIDYNRYAYSRGNPLKFSDPTGHCVNATTTNKPDEITYDNDDCWRFANTIGAMWDSTDYWSNRFTSKDVFFNDVANNGYNGTDFFQRQLNIFDKSKEGKSWHGTQPEIPQNELDDPQCGGGAACEALLNGVGRVEKKCNEIDCVAVGNDIVGVGSATLIVASPLCGPAVGVCAGVGMYIGGASTIVGTGWTIQLYANNHATNADLAVTIPLALKSVTTEEPHVNLAVTIVQLTWDAYASRKQGH